MKKTLSYWQMLGFIFTGITGVILHFLFDWANQSIILSPFSAINESIWEHMKLLFFPMFVFSIIESVFIGKDYKSFWCVKVIGIVFGMALIPVLYYSINGIVGHTPDFVNIAIFYVAAAISYILETSLLKKDSIDCRSPKKAIVILVLISVIFAILTFIPPRIPLFQDPITKTYGYFEII